MADGNDDKAGVYIHSPFCENKCPYCDFYSIKPNPGDIDRFVEAVIIEAMQKERFKGFEYDSIYFGGGTPSLLTPDQIRAIIDNLFLLFRFSRDVEVSIECNPSSFDARKARGYIESGVNRISLGLQSLCDKSLKTLGRLHNSDEAIRSFITAREAGFNNISVDLIYGIPGQSLDEWLDDLAGVISLGPEHISAYNMIVENNTDFGRLQNEGKLDLPSEDSQGLMYDNLCGKLQDAGYRRYEISNFSRKGYESRHNMKYWTGKKYLGLGPSGVSFDGKRRIKNNTDLSAYMEKINRGQAPPHETEEIGKENIIKERIMTSLRLTDGLSLIELKKDLGYDLAKKKQYEIQYLLSEGLIEAVDGRIKLSSKSLFISDAVILKLI